VRPPHQSTRSSVRSALYLASFAALLASLTLQLIPGTPAFAQVRAALSPTEYLDRLHRAEGLARHGIGAPSPGQMDLVRTSLGLPAVVSLQGLMVEVPTGPFLERLRGNSGRDFERALAHLLALEEQARLAAQAPPADQARERAALREAYRGVGEVRLGLTERLRMYVAEAIVWLFDRLARASGPGSLLPWLIVAGLAVAIGLLLWRLARRLGLVPERAEARSVGRQGASVDWLRSAEEASRRGDLEQAVRSFYRALLSALAARGVVDEAPSLTAGECRRAVGLIQPSLYPMVARATATFERVAYGRAHADRDEVEAMRRAEREARAA
jgi:Domain of unknown function (DUF4129)